MCWKSILVFFHYRICLYCTYIFAVTLLNLSPCICFKLIDISECAFLRMTVTNPDFGDLHRVAPVNMYWMIWFNVSDLNIILTEETHQGQVLCWVTSMLSHSPDPWWETIWLNSPVSEVLPSLLHHHSALLWLCASNKSGTAVNRMVKTNKRTLGLLPH